MAGDASIQGLDTVINTIQFVSGAALAVFLLRRRRRPGDERDMNLLVDPHNHG